MRRALAAVRTGTDGPETLSGTDRADRITGKGGNDAYYYVDDWGKDRLRDSGGKDTLNFSAASADVWVFMCPKVPDVDGMEIGGHAYEQGANELTNRVDLAGRIENARTGSGDDVVYGCSGTNGYSGGLGDDMLLDLDGYDLPNNLDVPKGDDRYSGFGPDSGNHAVADAGGRADVLDMRPRRLLRALQREGGEDRLRGQGREPRRRAASARPHRRHRVVRRGGNVPRRPGSRGRRPPVGAPRADRRPCTGPGAFVPPALPLAPIHCSAWKERSRNCVCKISA